MKSFHQIVGEIYQVSNLSPMSSAANWLDEVKSATELGFSEREVDELLRFFKNKTDLHVPLASVLRCSESRSHTD